METTIFTNEALGVDLTIIKHENGDLLFPAVAVAEMLGYKDPHGALKKHCDEVVKINSCETTEINGINGLSETHGILLIPESDLYSLIMRSRLKAAKQFQKWVTKEVLPSIRKTGSYHATPEAKKRSMHECLTEMTDEQFTDYITVVSELRQMKVTIQKQQLEIDKAFKLRVNNIKELLRYPSHSLSRINALTGIDTYTFKELLIEAGVIEVTKKGTRATPEANTLYKAITKEFEDREYASISNALTIAYIRANSTDTQLLAAIDAVL